MSSDEQRAAALANQRAAAFIRFQLANDHEALHLLLTEVGDGQAQLGFIAALGSLAGDQAVRAMGQAQAEAFFERVARASAALAAQPD